MCLCSLRFIHTLMLYPDKKTVAMKPLLYLISLIIFTVGLSSCSKDDDTPAAPAVVGRWTLNRAVTSGNTSSNANNLSIDLYYFAAYADQVDIYSDKTFNSSQRGNGLVQDFPGTWAFNSNVLTLNYNDGSPAETYNYSKNGNIEELTNATLIDFPIDSTGTGNGKIQLVYRK